jgi:ribosomal subunit interface protein
MPTTKITYHGLEPSDALTALIEARVAQLDEVAARIHSVRVVVDAPHQHQRHGRAFDIRVELRVAKGGVVVGRSSAEHVADDDPYQAVRNAFEHVRRQLTTAQVRVRGKQRAHEAARPSIRAAR